MFIPIWVLVTIVYLVILIILYRKGSKEIGWFGGIFEFGMGIALTACYLIWIITYFWMKH